MTDRLHEAIEAVSQLPKSKQNDIAEVILRLVDMSEEDPVELTAEERDAIRLSREQAARGEFATDTEIQELWDRYLK